MRKKLVVLAMVALLALVAVTPALAAGNRGPGGKGGPQFFSVLGDISDVGSDTITVVVEDGSRLVWPYIGEELTVYVTTSTAFYRWTDEGRVPIDFDDVEEGDTTNIHGTVTNGKFTADRVTVSPPETG